MTTTFNTTDFKEAMGRFATGVTIVTALEEGAPVGFSCQSFVSLSLDPPLVALAPAKTSTSWPRIARAGSFCVNVLSDRQSDVCMNFAVSGGDKFVGIPWHPAETGGAPIIEGSLGYIDCRVASVHDGGDHFVVFGAVKSLSEVPKIKPRPLLFYRGDYTGIEPDKTRPAQWRDDLEAFLTTTTQDTWL